MQNKSFYSIILLGWCLIPLLTAKPLIGGFGTPIFFNQYDATKIESIKQVKHIDHIEIIYQINKPALATLAKTIAKNLHAYRIIVKTVDLHDTAITKYNTSAVIVIIYFIPQATVLKKPPLK